MLNIFNKYFVKIKFGYHKKGTGGIMWSG